MKKLAYGLIWLSPVIAVLAVFTLYPAYKTVDMSIYTRYNYFRNLVFERGFENYRYLVEDRDFWKAMGNTLFYLGWTMPLSMGLGLAGAIALNGSIRFKRFFQTVYFLPFVTSTVAVALVWNWIFHSRHGLINGLLASVGVEAIGWLQDPYWGRIALVIVGVWKSAGYNLLIFLTGLQTIDGNFRRAAEADGAGFWQRTYRITVPLLSPSILFVAVITAINCFKVFDMSYMLFRNTSGPSQCGLTLVYYVYEKFYNQHHYGIASAAVVVLFVIITGFNLIQFRIGRSKVHY